MKQFVFFLLLCLATQLSAQLIVVQSATRQDWAGGFSYAHGTNYTIVFRVTQPNRTVTVDSLKLEGRLFQKPQQEDGSLTITKDSKGTTYILREALRWGNREEEMLDRRALEADLQPEEDRQAVVVYYHSNGVPHTIRIKEFTELMMIAYP
jgi:hypothetical protein